MEIIAISDIHGDYQVLNWLIELKDFYDVLIIAGDVTQWGDIKFYNKFFGALSKKGFKTFFVPGNHDPNITINLPNISNLHCHVIEYQGLNFCGFGGSNPTPFNTVFELDDDKACQLISKLPEKADIFVTHAPPYNTGCDVTESGQHIGSKPVRDFINKNKPKFVICGHVHESRKIDRLGDSIMINTGSAMDGFYLTISINGEPSIKLCKV